MEISHIFNGVGGESAFTKFSSWQSSKNVVQKRQCSYYQLFLCKVSTQYVLWREENISYLLNFLIIVSTTSRNKAFFSIIGYHNSRTVSRSAFHNRAQISRSIISVSRNRGHNSEISRTLICCVSKLSYIEFDVFETPQFEAFLSSRFLKIGKKVPLLHFWASFSPAFPSLSPASKP